MTHPPGAARSVAHDDTGPLPAVGSTPPPPATVEIPQPANGEAAAPATEPPAAEQPAAEQPTAEQVTAEPLTAEEPTAAQAAAEQATGDKAPGRAGRNLGAAIGVGVGLGAVILLSLLLWRPAFLAVLVAAVLLGVVELTRALEAGKFHAPLVPLLVGSLAMEALAWTRGASGLVVGTLFTVLAVVLWRLAGGPVRYLRDAAAGALVAVYVPLLAGFAVLLLVPDDGVARVLVFIAAVVCSDVGGYAAGVLFGKHPMAPSISPKKSWEGMAGSIAACVLLGALVFAFTFHVPWWHGAIYGVALAASATIGDLGESLIKRDLGIKDMGQLLPGHGGIMDRLDSLLPSAAVAYLLLSILAPV
jgi:phosphatidate cytidylyltransferase